MNRTQTAIRSFFAEKENRVKAAVFILVLILNILTVKTSDDLGYSISYGIADILRREYEQYMTWTGRSLAHLFARSFLALPKGIFNLANSLCFCVQIELMGRLAAGKREPVSALLYSLLALGVFLFAPLFGQTVLWETGACNYLWTAVVILAFLLPYRYAMNAPDDQGTWKTAVLMGLSGIAAGWTNENTGGAGILMVLFFMAMTAYRQKRIPLWQIFGLAGAVFGFVMMVRAPGNAIRAMDFVSTDGKAYDLVHDLYGVLDVLGTGKGFLVPSVFAGIGVCVWQIMRGKRSELLTALAFVFSAAAAVGAILLSPVPVLFDRSMYGAGIFLLTGCAVLFCPYLRNPKESDRQGVNAVRTGGKLVLAAGLVLSLFQYCRAFVDLSYTRYQYLVRENWVRSVRNENCRNPVVPVIYSEFFTTYNAMYGLNDLLESPSFVNNRNYALTHDLETVRATTLDRWNRIYRNGDPVLMNEWEYEPYLKLLKERPELELLAVAQGTDEIDPNWLSELEEVFGADSGRDRYRILARTEDGLKDEHHPEAFGTEAYAGGHYVWLNVSDEPELCDIVIDQQEYTNDRAGISIVVFDPEKDRVVDSISFDLRTGTTGTRIYQER
ncbi:MAG: hypothetical protein IKS32_03025, partial [Solobacterium sp.]|nr:hypothetical protein [Solobacterium sp.]